MQGDSARAATYSRSSKDRSDISIAAQSHALEQLATSHSLAIAERFEDAVESGATEDRPAFSKLLQAIKNPHRGWTYLLVYDTSRLARRRYIAQAIKHEAKKRGISILYATRPADVDPISEIVLDSMLEAMDEVHSLMSRQKGLAGMAENVRQGFRAGGRAPHGYSLQHAPTGAVRDGRPVLKSKLAPSDAAHQMRAYLKARAAGVPRVKAKADSRLAIGDTSLVGIEWNALTYAGHTVWNVNREVGTGSKRRPRAEWVIKRGTHEALITEREAESILSQLETSGTAAIARAARAVGSRFLLSGILYSTDGRAWLGHGGHYRLRKQGELAGRIVPAGRVDEAVIETLREFRTSERYLTWLLDETRRSSSAPASPSEELRTQIRKLERERQRAAETAVSSDAPEVFQRIVGMRTRQIEAVTRELEAVERESAAGVGLKALGVDELRELVESQDAAKVVRSLVDRVVLEPGLDCQIRLRQASYNGLWRRMASPGGSEAQPQGVILSVAPRLLRLTG